MLIILSPSKTINFDKQSPKIQTTTPLFLQEAKGLIGRLSGYSVEQIMEKEKVSLKLARLTHEYIHSFPLSLGKEKEAIYAYTGHVYDKLDARTLDAAALNYLDSHLRILSALYGVLRPTDSMKEYRLDMNSRLIPNLYDYWKEKVTQVVVEELKRHENVLINLASMEYFKMLNIKDLQPTVRVITPVFQQEKNGRLVTGSMYAKQARGAMLRFMCTYQIEDPEHLKAFSDEGYYFDEELSNEDSWFFIR